MSNIKKIEIIAALILIPLLSLGAGAAPCPEKSTIMEIKNKILSNCKIIATQLKISGSRIDNSEIYAAALTVDNVTISSSKITAGGDITIFGSRIDTSEIYATELIVHNTAISNSKIKATIIYDAGKYTFIKDTQVVCTGTYGQKFLSDNCDYIGEL